LTAAQADVVRAFLAGRAAERHHLVDLSLGRARVRLSVARQRPRPQVRARAPTHDLVGLDLPDDTRDRLEIATGWSSTTQQRARAGAARRDQGQRQFLEAPVGELVLGGDAALLAEARAVCRTDPSRRSPATTAVCHQPAARVRRAADGQARASTAAHRGDRPDLLAHGEVVTDVARLGAFVPAEIGELIENQRTAERKSSRPNQASAWRATLVAAIEAVRRRVATSGPAAIHRPSHRRDRTMAARRPQQFW